MITSLTLKVVISCISYLSSPLFISTKVLFPGMAIVCDRIVYLPIVIDTYV